MDAYTDRLSAFVDDEDLDANERRDIEAHLQTCVACRTVVADLRDIAVRARNLGDSPPPADLWPGIVRRIQPRRVSFTIPQLIAASLALMVLTGAMVWVSIVGGSRTDIEPIAADSSPDAAAPVLANFAEAEYDQAVADLERALAAGRERLDPQTVRVLEENLRTIDRAIEQSRKALRADPANLYLNTHLAATRQRKLDLLRSATALTTKS